MPGSTYGSEDEGAGGNMRNDLCCGHFLIRRHQMSELAGQNLHLDVRPRPSSCSGSPGSVPPCCWPLEKFRSGKKPGVDAATPFSRARPFKGGRNVPPASAPSPAARSTQRRGSAPW